MDVRTHNQVGRLVSVVVWDVSSEPSVLRGCNNDGSGYVVKFPGLPGGWVDRVVTVMDVELFDGPPGS